MQQKHMKQRRVFQVIWFSYSLLDRYLDLPGLFRSVQSLEIDSRVVQFSMVKNDLQGYVHTGQAIKNGAQNRVSIYRALERLPEPCFVQRSFQQDRTL